MIKFKNRLHSLAVLKGTFSHNGFIFGALQQASPLNVGEDLPSHLQLQLVEKGWPTPFLMGKRGRVRLKANTLPKPRNKGKRFASGQNSRSHPLHDGFLA